MSNSRLVTRAASRDTRRLTSRLHERPKSSPLLWLVDFTTQARGAADLSAIDPDLSFARASSGHSVQDSASTVITSGLGVDVLRLGSNGTAIGAVIECARTNLITKAINFGVGDWSSGVNAQTPNVGVSPSGASDATRFNVPSGGYSTYFDSGAFAAKVFSCWGRANSGTSYWALVLQGSSTALPGTGTSVRANLGTTWLRTDAYGTTGRYAVPADCEGIFPGESAGSSDIWVWGAQGEAAQYPTELIVTSGAALTRQGDQLQLTRASKYVSGGRIEVELDIYAKGAATEYAGDGAYVYLIYTNASNFVRIDTATLRLEIRVAGATWSLATALSWARGDRVTFRVAAGGGALQSWAKYSVNGGAFTDLGTTAAQGTWPSLTADLCNSGGASQLSCWLRSAKAYSPGGMPTS